MRVPPCLVAVLLAAVCCLLVAAPSAADRGGYRIERFDVEIEVRANSDLLVAERLQVDFLEPRHGIYRTIPIRYTDARGFAFSLGLRLLDVTDGDGRKVPAKLSDEGQYRKIRLGDPDRTVTGRKVYLLRYLVRDALGHFAEHDELYWNATGNEWNTTIEESSATVRLPLVDASEILEAAGYTGAFGSRERDVAIERAAPGVVRFETTRTLESLEGLTVVVAWAHGYVSFPGPATRAARFLFDNWFVALPLFWLGLLWSRYRDRGRDPEGVGPVMAQYEPPAGLTPGEVGALVDERVDLHDITATIVDLAVRGHLTIEVAERRALFGLLSSEETSFSRRREQSDAALTAHERLVLSALFASGDVVDTADLKNKFYERIPAIRRAVFDRLTADGYFAASPQSVRARWIRYGFGAGVATVAAAAAWRWVRGAVFPEALPIPVLVGVATVALFALFSRAMPRRTDSGVRAKRWALGFEEFARRVEGDRWKEMDPRQLFETLLPYAMALQVAGDWAQRFEGVYQQEPPRWFVGSSTSTHGFSTRSFEKSLSTAMSRTGESLVASPRSSGSGGGGSSGGGGGGGGGGSW